MRSFNTNFNTERAKQGTAPVNLVEFGFTSPLVVSDQPARYQVEEDFTTFTEVDPYNSILNIQADSLNLADLRYSYQTYLYKDLGAGAVGGLDFEHQSAFKVSNSCSNDATAYVWGLTDTLGPVPQQTAFLTLKAYFQTWDNVYLYLQAKGNGWTKSDATGGLLGDTFYYTKISYRADSRTLTCKIYSDQARSVLVDTLSIVLEGALSLRYLHAVSAYGAGPVFLFDGAIGALSIDSQYPGLVTDWSFVDSATDNGNNLVAPVTAPDLEITLANTGTTPFSSRFDSQDPESIPVTLYQWFKDIPQDSREVLFTGYVREVLEYNSTTCKLLVQGLWAKYDRLIGQDLLITKDDYPNADPDSIGKMEPLVYGGVDNLPCLAVEAGAMSTLVDDITAGATSIEVSDASAFPASGTIQIDQEQITYTGKSSNTLTGCTRGANSTDSKIHDAGTQAVQVLTQYVYMVAGHPVKSIGNVYVEGVRQKSGFTKYTGQSGDELTGYAGKAVVKFTALPEIKKQVNITAEVDEGTHTHTAVGTSTVTMPTGSPHYSDVRDVWYNETNAYDGDENTYAHRINMSDGDQLGIKFQRSSLGTMSSVRLKIVYSSDLPSSENDVLFVQIDTGAKQYLAGTGGVDNKTTVYKTFSQNSWTFWAYFNMDDVFGNYTTRVYEIEAVATYGLAVAAGPAEGIGVSLSGNSTADTVIGGQVTADLEGFQDDGSGTYTGTANALIERPDHVFKHLLVAILGMSADNIDSSAFTAAGTFFNTNSYAFGLAITRTEQANSLLSRLAFQCRSFFRFAPYGKARLLVRQHGQTADQSVDASKIKLDSLSIARTSTDILINRFSIHFDKDQTKPGTQAGDYLEAKAITDSGSTNTYGERTPTRDADFFMDAVRDATMAAHVGAFYLARHKRPRKMPGLSLFLDNMDLEPGDYIGITHPLDSMTGFVAEVLKTTHHLGSARRKAIDHLELITIDNGA